MASPTEPAYTCQRCQGPLEGGEEVCPHCDFNPRDVGLRYAGYALVGVVVLFTAVTLLGGIYPIASVYVMLGVLAMFTLTSLLFVFSLFTRPYRLARLFA